MREELRSGLHYLETLTQLLQRVRQGHPTAGIYDAAEIQWFWSKPRSTDDLPQLFWIDDKGRPVAAFAAIDFGDGSSLVYEDPALIVSVLPEAPADWVAQVIGRGLDHLGTLEIATVEVEVDRADEVVRGALTSRGFTRKGDALVVCWLDAIDRPEVSHLADGYRLVSRSDMGDRPHHMTSPQRRSIEARLEQASLYRPDLDLVILDTTDDPVAWGLFWYDPATSIGVVEPMRTQDEHQRRGLARHLLTQGIDRLARAGAERVKIGFEPDNAASRHLYTSHGFVPQQRTDRYAGTVASR